MYDGRSSVGVTLQSQQIEKLNRLDVDAFACDIEQAWLSVYARGRDVVGGRVSFTYDFRLAGK